MTFRHDIERAARGDIKWLPATVGLVEFLAMLHDLRDQTLPARALSASQQRPLTDHQRHVWALVAVGRSHTEIARAMGSSKGAVKQDIARIKDKLGVCVRPQQRGGCGGGADCRQNDLCAACGGDSGGGRTRHGAAPRLLQQREFHGYRQRHCPQRQPRGPGLYPLDHQLF